MVTTLPEIHISINQFAEFSAATNAAKARIIKQQQKVNKLLIPWYQSAKGSIKRYLTDVNDYTPIEQGVEKLKDKIVNSKRQGIDKAVSIEALQKMIEVNLPRILGNVPYQVIKPEVKFVIVNGVKIMVSPELVIKAKIGGRIVYGGVKIHLSKTKPFDSKQCNFVAILMYDYLSELAGENEHVAPQFCLCVDLFSNRVVSAKENHISESQEINKICNEIAQLWISAA